MSDRIFLRPPTEAEMLEVLGYDLANHGYSPKLNGPIERFVSYIEIETTGEIEEGPNKVPKVTGILTKHELAQIQNRGDDSDLADGTVESGAEPISFEGFGEVILIEDPRHPRYAEVNAIL